MNKVDEKMKNRAPVKSADSEILRKKKDYYGKAIRKLRSLKRSDHLHANVED